MDSFLQPTSSAASINGKTSTDVLSKRETFLSTYVRNQPWSLPDSVIYYFSKNPTTSKVYQKMNQSCKYFFIKNPLLIISDLIVKYEKKQWNIFLNGKNVDLNRVSSKLWITDKLRIDDASSTPQNSVTTVLSKIYQSDVKELTLQYQKIFINDLKFLASKCEKVILNETTVINQDESVVLLEKIVEVFLKIKAFNFRFSRNFDGTSANIVTPETVQKLIQLPHFLNQDQFFLCEVPETFDIDTFYDYIKINKKTKIYLNFVNEISHQYRNKLQKIINEIIATQNHHYNVPFIIFRGVDFSSANILLRLSMGM